MKIEARFDKEKIMNIVKNCGSKSVKSSISFLERMYHVAPEKLVFEIIDDVAFFGACVCKKHLRLYEIAVHNDFKRKGYGSVMFMRMKKICKQHCLEKITFRTSKKEDAIYFYKRLGAQIIGEKDEDWEMEIKV